MAIKCVVSCSFKFLTEVAKLIDALQDVGVEVLAPKGTQAKGSVNGFIILDTDTTSDPALLTKDFLEAIDQAHFHYAYMPSRRCGLSVAAEIAWARCNGTPTIWSCLPETFSEEVFEEFQSFLTFLPPDGMLAPEELVSRIKSGVITERMLHRKKEKLQKFWSAFPLSYPLRVEVAPEKRRARTP